MYCGKENPLPQPRDSNPIPIPMHHREPKLAHNLVLKMVEVLSNVAQLVVMDNFFQASDYLWIY